MTIEQIVETTMWTYRHDKPRFPDPVMALNLMTHFMYSSAEEVKEDTGTRNPTKWKIRLTVEYEKVE